MITADLYVPAGSLLWDTAGGKGQQTLKSSDHLGFRGKIALPPAQAKDLPPGLRPSRSGSWIAGHRRPSRSRSRRSGPHGWAC